MSFPLTKLAKVILTVVDAANAARSLTGAAGAERGDCHDHDPASPPSEHR